MSAATTQHEKAVIPAAIAQAEEEVTPAAVAQIENALAADNDREHPICVLNDNQKAMVEENMECIKAKLGLQDIGILLFRR